MGALNAGGVGKNVISASIWLSRVLWMLRPPSAIHSAAMDHGKLMTLVTGQWWSLLMAGDNNEVY